MDDDVKDEWMDQIRVVCSTSSVCSKNVAFLLLAFSWLIDQRCISLWHYSFVSSSTGRLASGFLPFYLKKDCRLSKILSPGSSVYWLWLVPLCYRRMVSTKKSSISECVRDAHIVARTVMYLSLSCHIPAVKWF